MHDRGSLLLTLCVLCFLGYGSAFSPLGPLLTRSEWGTGGLGLTRICTWGEVSAQQRHRGGRGRQAAALALCMKEDGKEGAKPAADDSAGGPKGPKEEKEKKKLFLVSRKELLVAFGVSLIPATLASLIAGEDAPVPEGEKLALGFDQDPGEELLKRKGVGSWGEREFKVGSYDLEWDVTEGLYILDGEATLSSKGRGTAELRKGTLASLPKGLKGKLQVTKTLKQRFKEYKAIDGFDGTL